MSGALQVAAIRARLEWEAQRSAWEDSLRPGDVVRVRWGHGRGFRATGRARVIRVNARSVRVALLEAVPSAGSGRGWPEGLEFTVARIHASRWHHYNGVHPLEEKAVDA